MALYRDAIFKRSPTLRQLIELEIKKFNLKILNRLTIKFDPFRDDVGDIREFSYYMHTPEAKASNQKILIKSEVLSDRSEQTLTFDLTNDQKFIFKCANLKVLEIFKLINKHITPLSPKEDILTLSKTKLQKKSDGKKRRI